MYRPAHFERCDPASLHALLRERPLATIVALLPGGMEANLIPLEFDPDAGPYGCLRGHLARANPLARELAAAGRAGVVALALFHGPQCYISPGWYPGKREHGKVVPTWNYVVVEARGRLRGIDDRDWLQALLHRLTTEHERSQSTPWRVDDAPADYIAQTLRAIVGIEIELEAPLRGKWKTSQNRSEADRDGVAAALRAQGDDDSLAMARLVQPAR